MFKHVQVKAIVWNGWLLKTEGLTFFMGVEKVRKTIKNYGKKCERLWENRVILYFFLNTYKIAAESWYLYGMIYTGWGYVLCTFFLDLLLKCMICQKGDFEKWFYWGNFCMRRWRISVTLRFNYLWKFIPFFANLIIITFFKKLFSCVHFLICYSL